MSEYEKVPYSSVTEVAKIVRATLKEHFPDTTFAVRSKRYAGGASIHVGWTDGPPQRSIERAIKGLQSISHMDNTDLVHHKQAEYRGERFQSGAHYIFCRRDFSVAAASEIVDALCSRWGYEPALIEVHPPTDYRGVWIDTARLPHHLHLHAMRCVGDALREVWIGPNGRVRSGLSDLISNF